MRAAVFPIFLLLLGVGSGYTVGYACGQRNERVAQQETRDYVNDRMSDAGFCRWLKVSKFPEHCAGLGK